MQEFLTNRPQVLVVDNEPMGRSLMDAVLRKENRYEVLTADTAKSGLETAQRARPDLMLLNAHLSGPHEEDGYTVCRILKSQPLTRRIPVVLVMGKTTSGDRVRGLEAGADDFLAKPFNRVELLARVRSLLRIKALNDQLDEVEDVIFALCRAAESREGGDFSASATRVAAYATAIGSQIGLGDEDVRILGQAAMLRDIGKIGLPDSLLRKPGALDEGETHSMQQHTLLGEQIISPLHSTAALLPIIRHHHERMDGRGYPDCLKGDEIPLGARIVAIADAYDAMTSQRPYRSALTPERAYGVLHSDAGRQWDPKLVSIFTDWLRQHPHLK